VSAVAENRWTESQQDAISARRGTVLVAAAAGSGKTAVLVQRAIERLTDPENPTSADRLLIVTFTKAAAAEMRGRLEKRLFELLRKNPGDPLLRRQSLLLSQAHIGTVDSFCAEMLREFFHLLELSPDFKIVSDKQEEELISEALNEALSEAFQQGGITELADAFTGERDDRRLMEMALTLYRFMQSHPFPEKWLREKTALYTGGDSSQWEEVILRYAEETAEHCESLCAAALEEALEGGEVGAAFSDALTADRLEFSRLRELAGKKDWDGAACFLESFSPKRRGRLTGFEEDPLRRRLEAVRKECKRAVEELSRSLFGSREQCGAELLAAAPLLESLMELTLDFSRRYDEKKREKNFLDYSDLEHFAIRLFLTPEGEKTQAAKEVSARFDEIMIDEYQDINEVQDSLFRAVSRNSDNLFMVGDVKQSIYGFRRAMPEIFLRCRRSFQKYDREKDGYPAYLVLDRNFRSRREVTDTVNFVFSRLMSQAAGDMDYTGEERLVCGASYEEKQGCETELALLSRPTSVPAETAEGEWIGNRIREMVESGFTVTENGRERPLNYGDFCILIRSANQHAHAYAVELQKLGIPAKASVTGGFFSAAEIGVMLSFLQVIDNPNQDIPLLAVLMSPIYGFSPDDTARLREKRKEESIYVSLLRSAKGEERCAKLLRELREYRSLAATMPSDAFLTYLYEKTGYPDMVLAMEDGGDRIQNLRLLQAYAREYEDSGYHGISGFVRFLDKLRRNDSDLQAAEAPPEQRNAVSIMSIHKSKGLEFPVCIVAGCGRNFVSDQRADVLLHPELGLGVKLRDPKRSARFTTTAREAISLETARSAAAEELRVLYVAMTRAKEKLILVGSGEAMEKKLERLAAEVTPEGISPYTVRKAKNAAEWLLLCALCHPDGQELRSRAEAAFGIVCREDYSPWRITLEEYEPLPGKEVPEEEAEPAAPDEDLYRQLKREIEFSYPQEASLGIPVKVAASKLAAEQGGRRELTLSRPAWMGEKGMTPAERGIALHEFMQFADFQAVLEDPQAELRRLVDCAYLTPEQADAVEVERAKAFLKNDLGRRVLASEEVQRERRFTAMIPASLAEPDRKAGAEEEVVLQGAVDCTFTEGGKLHIIDFKTDRVKTMEELWERYATQLHLYAAAMERVSGMEVGELFLYSTHLNEARGISN